MITGKEVLITGGTGSLGKTLTKLLILEHEPKGIRIYSRDELKQWQLQQEMNAFRNKHGKVVPIAFILGDVRDPHRTRRAFKGVDIVIHTAALKQVGACEDNPLEAVQTNVLGAVNVMNAALDCGVERVMNVSTDKAVKPVNLYGATKLSAEKLLIDGNVYAGGRKPVFSCCRYGNVLASRGSVAHVFRQQVEEGREVTVTHKAMTRFWITLPRVARFLLERVEDMRGGEVFVPKMKSMGIYQMAVAMGAREGSPGIKVVGVRQGEKLHEALFSEEEYVIELPDRYHVFPSREACAEMGTIKQFEFNSGRNPHGELNADELNAMLADEIE